MLSPLLFLFLNGPFTPSKHGLLLARCLVDTNGAAKVWQDGKYSQASWEGPRAPIIQLQEFLSTLFLLYLIGKGPGDFWLWKPGAQIGSHRHLAHGLWLTPAFSGLVCFSPVYILWSHYSFSLWTQGVQPPSPGFSSRGSTISWPSRCYPNQQKDVERCHLITTVPLADIGWVRPICSMLYMCSFTLYISSRNQKKMLPRCYR